MSIILTLIPHELMRVAQGCELKCQALDGTEILVRLPTADEAVERNRAARESLRREFGIRLSDTDALTRERAEELVRPLPPVRYL